MDKLQSKLDAKAQIQLAIGELPDDLEILLRLDDDITEAQKASLENVGCSLQSASGKVVAGKSTKASLKEIAEQDFVRRIEVSRDTFPEPSEDSEPSQDKQQE